MRKSVLVLLIVFTLLVVDTDAWFWRRSSRRRSSVRKSPVRKTAEWVVRHKTWIGIGWKVLKIGLLSIFGKRSADYLPPCPQEVEEKRKALQLLEELEKDCPSFGINATVGLTGEAVADAFDLSDVDDDDALDVEELAMFEGVIEVYEKCVEMELAKGE